MTQLVMNNFTSHQEGALNGSTPKHLESLVTTIFQSMYPPISPQATSVKTIKRVLLLDRIPSSTVSNPYTISLRHYSITARRPALSSQLRRLNASEKRSIQKLDAQRSVPSSKNLPDLSRLDDVAQYLLDPAGAGGYTSESSAPGSDAEVELIPPTEAASGSIRYPRRSTADQLPANQKTTGLFPAKSSYTPSIASANDSTGSRVEKRVIKLHELGPRMTLRLLKVEEGVCDGKVMWHEYITKTKEELVDQEKEWGRKKKVKDERRRVQRENVEKKREQRLALAKSNGAVNGQAEDEGTDDGLVSQVASDDLSGYEDAMWEDDDGRNDDAMGEEIGI